MAGLIVFEENIEHEARTAIDKTSLPFIKKFSRTAQIYSFTTENLAGYAQALPFKGAGVLTVSGSGDQIIAAYMNGATEVTGFDINLLSGLFSELKLAAMLGLSFEDFKGFLLKEESKGTNPRALDFDVYTHLRSKLSPLSSQFFDRMYEMFGKNGAELRQSKLFNNR